MPSQRKPTSGVCLLGSLILAIAAWQWRVPSARGFIGGSAPAAGQRRLPKVACNGVDKAMKERIESVQKTGKLTDAMRLVAAAKVRRAQDGVARSRPFSQELTSMIKGLVKKLKGSGLEAELPMLRVPEKVKNVALVVITADRGLCGGYNTFIMKKVAARVKSLNAEGIVPKVVIVGRKGLAAKDRRLAGLDYNYTGTFFRMPDTITAKSAGDIGDEVRSLFLSGEADKVEIVYAKFLTLLKNEATLRTLLPLSPTGIEDPEDETFKLTSEEGKLKVVKEKAKSPRAKEIEPDVIFDQPPETILNSMLPLYLNSQLLSLLFDSQASELSSRMSAMKAATDNADDLVKKLTIIFNKKRQAAITQEICEISAGALALEDKKSAAGPPLGVFDNEDTVGPDFLKEVDDGSIPDVPPLPDLPQQRPALVES